MKGDFTYICEKGHVDLKPSMGTYQSCQVLVPVGLTGRGFVGCGCPVVMVPYDPTLEATFKIGGPEAVLAVVRERLARESAGTELGVQLGAAR